MTASTPQPPPQASGCALGCFVFSLLLFVATIAGSLYLLDRNGLLPFFS
jgi:hypothetical protein